MTVADKHFLLNSYAGDLMRREGPAMRPGPINAPPGLQTGLIAGLNGC